MPLVLVARFFLVKAYVIGSPPPVDQPGLALMPFLKLKIFVCSRDDGESTGGRRKAFTLDKMLQTEPHGVSGMGVQTDSLYARAASAQTVPLHPPIDEGSQTDRAS